MTVQTRTLKRLTPEQVAQYHALGYVKGFRVFTEEEVAQLPGVSRARGRSLPAQPRGRAPHRVWRATLDDGVAEEGACPWRYWRRPHHRGRRG